MQWSSKANDMRVLNACMHCAQQLLELLQTNLIALIIALAILFVSVFISRRSRGSRFLDPQLFKPLPLTRIDRLTHNTKRFVFGLPDPRMRLGLPTGQHITFLAKDSAGKDVYRPYTPVTDDDTLGHVEFIIKIYPHGKMTQIMDSMKVGDTMLVKGPRGRFNYTTNLKRAIGMLAGGTGVTPMYQVAAAILKDPQDTTKISLVFGNLTADDILIKQELDELASDHPDRFNVYYVLNSPPDNWSGGAGFITKDIIQLHLPAPAADVMVLSCGPKPMCDAMKGYLDQLGHSEDNQFQF